MCGIAGFFCSNDKKFYECLNSLEDIKNTLFHRGPDDSGVWKGNESQVVFGHRRLSILDLTKAGHQPMTSSCGRYVVTFNGEVYNHLDLRKELQSLGKKIRWIGYFGRLIILKEKHQS